MSKKVIQTLSKKKEIAIPKSLEEIKLSGDTIWDSLTIASAGAFVGEILAKSTPIGHGIWDWADKTKQKVKEEKMNILFRRYSAKFTSIDEASARLHTILETKGGQALFTKIVQILDNGINDEEWIGLLANVLKDLSNDEFSQQFELYSFALAQMGKLSPQALILLSKYENWKAVSIQSTTTTSRQTLSGDWDSQVANFLAHQIGITDSSVKLRMGHSFVELQKEGLIILDGSRLAISIIGAEIYRLVTQ